MKFMKKHRLNYSKRMEIRMGSMGMENKKRKIPEVSVKIEYSMENGKKRKPHFFITGLRKIHATEEAKAELKQIYEKYLDIANANGGKLSKDILNIFEKHIQFWLIEKIDEGSVINVEEAEEA